MAKTVKLKDIEKKHIRAIKVGDEEYEIHSANEDEYEEIFKKWFPDTDLTPENLKKAPKRIIAAAQEQFVAEEIDLCLKEVYLKCEKDRITTRIIIPRIEDDALLTMNFVRTHILKLKERFDLDKEVISRYLLKIVHEYLTPVSVTEVIQFFFTPHVGITNRFLIDMETNKDKLRHIMLMESFDEIKKEAEEHPKTHGDTDGDVSSLIYTPDDYWRKYLTRDDADKSLKYKTWCMGDWSASADKDLVVSDKDLIDLIKPYFKTDEEDAEAEERRAARSRVTDSFDGDR